MLLLTLPLLLIFSDLFTQLSHPLPIVLILLIQTWLISITLLLSRFSLLFSYILFLIFLGDILVLFIYVVSIASNEAFIPSMLYFFITLTSVILSLRLLILYSFLTSRLSSLPWSFSISASIPSTIRWIYNTLSINFTIFVICYLLLMLIIVVKIVNLFKGPLCLTHK